MSTETTLILRQYGVEVTTTGNDPEETAAAFYTAIELTNDLEGYNPKKERTPSRRGSEIRQIIAARKARG